MFQQVALAQVFAINAHGNQTRRDSDMPYCIHLARVALAVTEYYSLMRTKYPLKDLLIAAWLHDTIEDTAVTKEHIVQQFGQQIADLVEELTSDLVQVQQLGKTAYLTNKMNNMSKEALFIKLLDRRDNITDYYAYSCGNEKAIQYAEQTLAILDGIQPEKLSHLQVIVEDIKNTCFQIFANQEDSQDENETNLSA